MLGGWSAYNEKAGLGYASKSNTASIYKILRLYHQANTVLIACAPFMKIVFWLGLSDVVQLINVACFSHETIVSRRRPSTVQICRTYIFIDLADVDSSSAHANSQSASSGAICRGRPWRAIQALSWSEFEKQSWCGNVHVSNQFLHTTYSFMVC